MRDTLEIGPTPCNEDCQQLGTQTYTAQAAKAECYRFIGLIREKCGHEPAGADLRVKSNNHDLGTYYEVAVSYDEENEQAVSYAYHIERHAPQTWDGEGAMWKPELIEA